MNTHNYVRMTGFPWQQNNGWHGITSTMISISVYVGFLHWVFFYPIHAQGRSHTRMGDITVGHQYWTGTIDNCEIP